MRRDGFGRLSQVEDGLPGHAVTCLIRPHAPARVVVNVEGVTAELPLRVEPLDGQDRPIAGYSGDAAALVTEPGVRQAVVWPSGPWTPTEPFAIRVELPAGSDGRLYAIYVDGDQ